MLITQRNGTRPAAFINFMKNTYNEKTRLMDIMKIIFDPSRTGFKSVASYDKLPSGGMHEVWTDSDSLLIAESYYDEFIERVKNEIN